MAGFFDSLHCRPHERYCGVCRLRHEPAHRAALLNRYGSGGIDTVDFDCPKGVEWGWQGEPQAPQTIEQAKPRTPCLHLGGIVGRVECKTCGGGKLEALHECAIYHRCTITRPSNDNDMCCHDCKEYQAKQEQTI